MKRIIKNQTGIILLLTLFILSGILVITLAAADLVMAGLKMNRLTGYSSLAFFAAEAGMERSLWEIRKNDYVLPDVDTINVFSLSNLGNGSAYQVNYATSTPYVTFKSTGSYRGVKRSVEITYVTGSGDSGCVGNCTGKECGDNGCGVIICGSCGINESCVVGICIADTQIYNCADKPATGTDWNTVSSYIQTWNGSAWSPADDAITEYNATPDTTSCRYTCATNYTWNGSSCAADTQTYNCAAKPATGTDWNTVSSYTQTWNGSAWSPADDAITEHNETGGEISCQYKCASGYDWSGSSCVAIVCSSAAQCNDGNSCTTDSCTNPGAWNASCTHTNVANGTQMSCSGCLRCWAPDSSTTSVCSNWDSACPDTYGSCGDPECNSGICGNNIYPDLTVCATNSSCYSGICTGNSRTYTCAAKPATGTDWNTVSSYTQTWNGSAWSPADDAITEYNATADTASCRYACAVNYTWNGSICIPSCAPNYGQACGESACVNAGTYNCSGVCVDTTNKDYGTVCPGTHNICNGSGSCVPDCSTPAYDYFAYRPDVAAYCDWDTWCGLWHWCVHGHNLDQRDDYPCRCYHDYDCDNNGLPYYSAYCP